MAYAIGPNTRFTPSDFTRELPRFDPFGAKATYLKVIGSDNKSANGGDFDYTDYLPNADGTPGKWLPFREASICNTGWHWTTPDGMWTWMKPGSKVFVAEPYGEYEREGPFAITADRTKICSESGRLLAPYVLPMWFGEACKAFKELKSQFKPSWLKVPNYWSGAATPLFEGCMGKIGDARAGLRKASDGRDFSILMVALAIWPGKFTHEEAVYIQERYWYDRECRDVVIHEMWR